MGQRVSCPSPDVAPGLVPRSRSQSLPDEANEATERPNRDVLMPLFEDNANSGKTELKRTHSSCELVYRRPARGLSRTQRRYASQESLQPHSDQPLSPGGSENSIASSSSSVESQRSLDSRLHRTVTGTTNAYKKKVFKSGIPIRIPTSQSSSDSEKRASSSTSAPELGKTVKPKKQQADIVAAVTQRLYPKKKITVDAASGNGDSHHHNKEGNKDETVATETCSRASNRLRDLSRRLLSVSRDKNNVTPKAEAETQTEKDNETKEAAVGTEKTQEPSPLHAFITSEVFLPMCLHQCSFMTDTEGGACGGSVQPDLLASRTCHGSPCSDSPRSRASPSPSVSVELPACFGMEHYEDECFSDDSLDDKRDIETDSLDDLLDKPCRWKVVHLSSGQDFLGTDHTSIHTSNNNNNGNNKSDDSVRLNQNHNEQKNIQQTRHDNFNSDINESVIIEGELPAEENWEVRVLIGDETDLENASVNFKISNERISSSEPEERTLFNGLPVSSEDSDISRPPSSDDNNSCPSPVSSEAASTGSDTSSGDDFVYYLQAPEEGGSAARCLYTIAENSEHSDHSESLEPSSLSPPLHVPVSRPIETTPVPLTNPQKYTPLLEITSKHIPLINEHKNLDLNTVKTQSNFSIENIFSKYSPTNSQNSVSFPLNITAPSNYSSLPSNPTDSLQSSLQNSNSRSFYPEFTRSTTPPVSSTLTHTRAAWSSSPRAQTVLTSSLLGSPPLSSVAAREKDVKHPLANVYVPLNSPKLVSRSPSPNLIPPENNSTSPSPNHVDQKLQLSQSPNLITSDNTSTNFSFNHSQKQNTFDTQHSNLNSKYSPVNVKSRSPSPNLINLKSHSPDLQQQQQQNFNLSQPDLTINQAPQKLGNINFNHSNSYDSPPSSSMNSKYFNQQFYLPHRKNELVNTASSNSQESSGQRIFPSAAASKSTNWAPESPLQLNGRPSPPPPLPSTRPALPQLNSWFTPVQAGEARPPASPSLGATAGQQEARGPGVNAVRGAAGAPAVLHQQEGVGAETLLRESRRIEATPRRLSRDKTSSSPDPSPPAVQWADPRQRKFLNVSVVAPTRALPASVGLQGEGASTASEDSITFVYVGPARRHAPPVLLELVRRSVGGRGLQRSVSLDSATRALARLSQRRRGEVVRACSMDTLLPEETYAFLEPARRERGPPQRSDSTDRPVSASASPRRDGYYSGTQSESEVRSTDDDFDDSPPPELPRVTGQVTPGERNQRWADMKGMILGHQPRPHTSPSPPPPPRQRTVGKKAVSWSDVSGCGLLSSPSTNSLPSPTSLTGSPKPIIKKSSLAPVPQSPIPSPTSRSPLIQSPVPDRVSRRDRLHLDLHGPSPPLRPQPEQYRLSPDFRQRPDPNRLSPDPSYFRLRPEPVWQRERSMSAPSSPYGEHPWYTQIHEDRSPSPGDWQREYRGPSASVPGTPHFGSPSNFPRIGRSRSPPRCGSPRCHSLGDVSELGRDAESLRAFLEQATTLLHSLSDLSRYLEQPPPPATPPSQMSAERAVQTEIDEDNHVCCSRPRPPCEPRRQFEPNRQRICQRTEPMSIIHRPEPVHHRNCCHAATERPHFSPHSCCSNHVCSSSESSPNSWYEPSMLERRLEASCARLEATLQQPPAWQSLCEETEPRTRVSHDHSEASAYPFSGPPLERVHPARPSSRPPLPRAAWQQSPSLPPLPSRSMRPHFSPRAYMRHLLGVRRQIIEAARQDQLMNPDEEI